MALTRYFYDTYAILAYLSGNKNYRRYFEEEKGVLTVLNLMETYYALLREYGEDAAEEAYTAFSRFKVEIEDEDVKEAMKFRLKLAKEGRNLSYTDAIGYRIALKRGIKFLTGDRNFKNLENVEWVV